MAQLYIQMFGDFTLRAGDAKISDRDNRSKKVWLLLAYILCRRGRQVSRKELIGQLWENESTGNPENALKTTFYRVRALLDQLWPSAGHQLILWKDGGYSWNPEIPITVDTDEFDRLCAKEGKDEDTWLQDALQALSLYRGDFLGNLAIEAWIIPITTYYHNRYIQTILDVVPLLSARGHHEKAADLCRTALRVEPYHESLHYLLMQALYDMGDMKGVAAVYEELSDQLFSELGIKPGKETKALYRLATQSISDHALPIDTVLEHLQEEDAAAGALQCEFDYFKVLCHVEARAMARSGKATHIALLTVSGSLKDLSKRSLSTAMEHLGEQIRLNLRRGDTFSRCSLSQYAIMLPQANYENSCMVCRRILGAFAKRHPHSPARITFAVQPLTSDFTN